MENLHVSAIIPTHCREELLKRAISSVIEQEVQPVELIVVDDISRQETRDLVEHFSAIAEFDVLYVERKNFRKFSSSASINLAARKARGDVLAILDDDDYWTPDYLGRTLEKISTLPADFVVTATTFFDENGVTRPGKLVPEPYDKNDWLARNPGMGCSNIVVRKNAWDRIGGMDGYLFGNADRDFFIRLMESGARLYVMKERLVMVQKFGVAQTRGNPGKVLHTNLRFYRRHGLHMPLRIHILNWKKFYQYAKMTVVQAFGK